MQQERSKERKDNKRDEDQPGSKRRGEKAGASREAPRVRVGGPPSISWSNMEASISNARGQDGLGPQVASGGDRSTGRGARGVPLMGQALSLYHPLPAAAGGHQ